jgi:SulP family sulfate permease
VFQILIGLMKLGRYIRFVSRSVMTGFVNALAILIFLAQMPDLIGADWQTFALVGAALAIIYADHLVEIGITTEVNAIALMESHVLLAIDRIIPYLSPPARFELNTGLPL